MIFGKSVLHRTKSDCMMRKLAWVQSYKWFQQACLISAPSQFIFFIFLSKLLSTCSLKRHLWKTRWEIYQTVGNNDEYVFFNKGRRLFWKKMVFKDWLYYTSVLLLESSYFSEISCWKNFLAISHLHFFNGKKNQVRKLQVSVKQKEGLSQKFAFIIWSCENLV